MRNEFVILCGHSNTDKESLLTIKHDESGIMLNIILKYNKKKLNQYQPFLLGCANKLTLVSIRNGINELLHRLEMQDATT